MEHSRFDCQIDRQKSLFAHKSVKITRLFAHKSVVNPQIFAHKMWRGTKRC